MPKSRLDLVGRIFNRLTVVAPLRNPRGCLGWKCLCQCGTFSFVTSYDLTHGSTKSCGCFQRETAHLRPGFTTKTHGMSNIPEYWIWCGIRRRCLDKKRPQFKNYGGRGIKICNRWDSFENFYKDMGPRPSIHHSIDRYPDNDGNYEPGNCRWATFIQQANNRRGNRIVFYRNQSMTLMQAIRAGGQFLRHASVQERLSKGWSIMAAVETPSRQDWAQSEIDTLIRLWGGRYSAGMIANELPGRTRNSIIGKAHRLGLAQRAPVVCRPFNPPHKRKPIRFAKPMPKPDVPYAPLNLTLADLTINSCLAIVSDTDVRPVLYCGMDKVHESYCQHHYSIYHTSPTGPRGPVAATVAIRNRRRAEAEQYRVTHDKA